jgi:hypothetical protein
MKLLSPRKLGTVAVLGCGDAADCIKNGQEIRVCCAKGKKEMYMTANRTGK